MAPKAQIEIGGVPIELIRKRIYNFHLRVYPPDGRVVVSVPWSASKDEVLRVIRDRWDWIVGQRERCRSLPVQTEPDYRTDEYHWVLGQRHRLVVVPQEGRPRVALGADDTLYLFAPPDADARLRQLALQGWYKQRLKAVVPPLLAKWAPVMGVAVAEWGIRPMKTRWGTCKIPDRRMTLNLDLAKRPIPQIEYIVVHEMNHLLERLHNQRFHSLMDRFLPDWRELKRLLNQRQP